MTTDMPEEKNSIRMPEDAIKKPESEDAENIRDILDVPGEQTDFRADKEAEKHADSLDARYVSQYERKLAALQARVTPAAGATKHDDSVEFDADAIRHMEDAAGRVQKLLELARAKGVMHAVSVAEHIDAYTLDRTHDRIADELSDELRKQGMLDGDKE